MANNLKKNYILGDYRLETDKQLLSRDGQPVHLPRRPFQVLLYLIEHRDQVVSRDDLLDRFWDGKDVYDDALRKCVGTVRKALGDHSGATRFIETRYAGGYRFIGPLEEQLVGSESAVLEIERTRGVRIIVEEEEVHEPAPGSGQTQVIPTASLTLSPSASKPSRQIVTLTAALVAIVLTVSAMNVYRSRNRSTADAKPRLHGYSVPRSNSIDSIAVLPLKNLSGDLSQEYFSDGLTESLITGLSNINGLKVISRSSVFTFKGKEVDPREVGQKLGVKAVLEGTVQRDADRVRVDVRLVSTEDGRVLWASGKYERAPGDIFIVQDEITRGVTSGLSLKLGGEAEQQFAKRYTDNAQAQEAYLKGRYYWNKRTGDDIKKAIPYFEQAIALDPSYALAYAGLADCYTLGIWFVPFEPKEALAKSKAAVMQALALDGSLAEAHACLGGVYFYDWEWEKAAQEYQRAVELNPGSAMLHHTYSLSLNVRKRPDEAIRESERALELDPLSLVINTDLGMAYFYARRYEEAIAAYKRSLDLDPHFEMAHYYLGEAYMMKGSNAEAIGEFRKTTDASHGRPLHLAEIGLSFAYAGKIVEARRTLDKLISLSRREYVPSYYLADFYAALGDKEQAFVWLDKAYDEHSPYLCNVMIDPCLDPLRSDPRFGELLRRVGLHE